jgi:hypothetical protein
MKQEDIEQLTADCIYKTTQRCRFNQAFMDKDYELIMASIKVPIYAWVRK